MDNMNNSYRQNRLYKTIELFCILRKTTIGAMCKDAGVSPGLVTDLKMGRKLSLQLETASKLANALKISVSLFNENEIEVNRSGWGQDEFSMWNDSDTDADRLFVLKHYGFPEGMKKNDKFLNEALRAIIENVDADEVPSELRDIDDNELKAAFFNGSDEGLTEADKAELWQDAREYIAYKAEQKRKKK